MKTSSHVAAAALGLWLVLSLPVIGATNEFSLVYSFAGTNDGGLPTGTLVQGNDGNIYGTTTYAGGPAFRGNVFSLTQGGSLKTVYAFQRFGGAAESPGFTGLAGGSDGALYGTVYGWGYETGAVFRVTKDGDFTIFQQSFSLKYAMVSSPGFVSGTKVGLYGIATSWGSNTNGGLFQIDSTGAFHLVCLFPDDAAINTGIMGVLHASDGNFYGTTRGLNVSGAQVYGTIFRINSAGQFLNVFSFTGGSSGSGASALIEGADGNLYGTCDAGAGIGVIFRFTKNGQFTPLYSSPKGKPPPIGTLTQGIDGNLYGTASYGTGSPNGSIFRFTTNGTFSLVYSFKVPSVDGQSPPGPLLMANDGYLYGIAQGGPSNNGVIFRLSVPIQPSISIGRTGQSLMVNFQGNLYSSTHVTGPWVKVTGATNPYPVQVLQTQEFFRTGP